MAGRGLLISVRHGRTAWNAEGRFQGQADPPLDATGRRQRVEASRRVAREVCHFATTDPPIVMASDLARAAATAGRIAADLGVPLVLDARLREVNLGGWEGLTRQQAKQCFPGEWAEWTAGRAVRRGGGETETEAGARVAAAIEEILENQASSGEQPLVAVVGHGLSLRAGLERLRGDGLIGFPGQAPHLGNGDLFVVPTWARPLRTPQLRMITEAS
jgi:glucosyl-3-phosphoglycerate phosphatase